MYKKIILSVEIYNIGTEVKFGEEQKSWLLSQSVNLYQHNTVKHYDKMVFNFTRGLK